jgi:hypothetical protein
LENLEQKPCDLFRGGDVEVDRVFGIRIVFDQEGEGVVRNAVPDVGFEGPHFGGELRTQVLKIWDVDRDPDAHHTTEARHDAVVYLEGEGRGWVGDLGNHWVISYPVV